MDMNLVAIVRIRPANLMQKIGKIRGTAPMTSHMRHFVRVFSLNLGIFFSDSQNSQFPSFVGKVLASLGPAASVTGFVSECSTLIRLMRMQRRWLKKIFQGRREVDFATGRIADGASNDGMNFIATPRNTLCKASD